MGIDVDAVTKSGRLFHTRAAATGKARSPTVDSRDGGTARAGVDVFTNINSSERYAYLAAF